MLEPNAFSMFESIHAEFEPDEYFLTREQGDLWQKTKPFVGLKILHNFPLYHNTLLKIEALLKAGAEVWVGVPQNIPADPRTIQFVKDLGLPFIPVPQKLAESFDFILDCSGDYAHLIQPKIGIVEVTGTGTDIYRNCNSSYPVISVDDSRLKEFETTLGTGDGFLRALQHWLPEDFSQKAFVIFGFGKVGNGIAQKLKPYVKEIVFAEVDPVKIKAAQAKGFRAYHVTDPLLVPALHKAFAIITATGKTGIMSQAFQDKSIFKNAHLINMGVHDEYGERFATKEVLFDKQGLNFSLPEPTLLRYMDPIFYAHNLGVELLLSGKFKAGYHSYPKAMDDAIIKRWQDVHGEVLKKPTRSLLREFVHKVRIDTSHFKFNRNEANKR